MKIQQLTVIFIIIILPVTILLSSFVQMQINIINVQVQYDTKLYDATYDGVQAFQINTDANYFSTVSDSLRRDVEASINAFMTSLASNLGVSGYTINYLTPYIPAIVYTLYDGYYIYSPYRNVEDDTYEHMLKPYIYYTARYVRANTDITVNYTLDNYITVLGTVNNKYCTKSGYLIDTSKIEKNITDNDLEILSTNEETDLLKSKFEEIVNNAEIKYDGVKIENIDAKKYYIKAIKFTNWVNENLSTIEAQDARQPIKDSTGNYIIKEYDIFKGKKDKIFAINSNNNPDEESIFSFHKRDVIKESIQNNLNSAIARYNESSQGLNSTYNFQMPVFQEEEWNKILTNVNMVTFLQGLPLGVKYYNNYCIVTSTNNLEYIDKENIYFIDENVAEGLETYYHKIDCTHFATENNLQGYRNVDYNWYKKNDSILKKEYTNNKLFVNRLACYYCIVSGADNRIGMKEIKENTIYVKRKKAYYESLARLRNQFYKINEYMNNY